MTRHLPVAHLSAEAVAAVADGCLSGAPLARAERHLANCLDCAQEVVAQRQASFALRSASDPLVPGGLLERLCGLPLTVPLDTVQAASALSPEGEPVMASFRSVARAGRASSGPRRWLTR